MTIEKAPLVTFALFAYRHERFVAEAVAAALAQDYQPMEIIIADDASPDGTAGEIDRALAGYEGPIPVRVIRNARNTGLIATLNRVMAEAKGEIILAAAGDDVSLPFRTSETVRAFLEDAGVNSVYANGIVIDGDGRELRHFYPVPPSASRHHLDFAVRDGFAILGASHAWHRRVFDVFGPLPEGLVFFEDHAIPFRSAFLGRIRYVEQPLILYRQHGDNAYLGAPSIAGSVQEWHCGLERSARNERAMLMARLEDLKVVARTIPGRRVEIERLKTITEREIEDRTVQIRLFGGLPLPERVLTVFRQGLRGMPPRRLARWILTFLLPRFYLRRLRRRAAYQ